MSAAAPTADAAGAAPPKKGKKKLIIIAVAVLVLLLGGGGGAFVLLKKKPPVEGEEGEAATSHAEAAHSAKPDPKHPPTFLPLDPFVVNLADKEADRYAQVGITFEVEDAKFAEAMKAFMPAIRNTILLILSHKSSAELLDRAGKEQLAAEILRESARTMGIEVEEPVVAKKVEDDKAAADDAEPKPKKKKKPQAPAEPNPIKHVHFSNFIVQ